MVYAWVQPNSRFTHKFDGVCFCHGNFCYGWHFFQIWYATHFLCFIVCVVYVFLCHFWYHSTKQIVDFFLISILNLSLVVYALVICVFRANLIRSVNMSEQTFATLCWCLEYKLDTATFYWGIISFLHEWFSKRINARKPFPYLDVFTIQHHIDSQRFILSYFTKFFLSFFLGFCYQMLYMMNLHENENRKWKINTLLLDTWHSRFYLQQHKYGL